jgi:hypothetical protein
MYWSFSGILCNLADKCESSAVKRCTSNTRLNHWRLSGSMNAHGRSVSTEQQVTQLKNRPKTRIVLIANLTNDNSKTKRLQDRRISVTTHF